MYIHYLLTNIQNPAKPNRAATPRPDFFKKTTQDKKKNYGSRVLTDSRDYCLSPLHELSNRPQEFQERLVSPLIAYIYVRVFSSRAALHSPGAV